MPIIKSGRGKHQGIIQESLKKENLSQEDDQKLPPEEGKEGKDLTKEVKDAEESSDRGSSAGD